MRDLTRASTRMTHFVSNTHNKTDYCMRNSDFRLFKYYIKSIFNKNRFEEEPLIFLLAVLNLIGV